MNVAPARRAAVSFLLASFAIFDSCSGPEAPAPKASPLVTREAAGRIKLGMTVAQAKAELAPLPVTRASDGEGVALVFAGTEQSPVLRMFAGEEDPAKPLNEAAVIEFIEVLSPEYATQDGVRPGMTLEDAAKKLGNMVEIQWSEIESREFAKFERQPEWLVLRVTGVDSNAGVYPPETGPPARTAKPAPGAKIVSLAIRK